MTSTRFLNANWDFANTVLFPVPFLLTKRVVLFCNMVFRSASDASGATIKLIPVGFDCAAICRATIYQNTQKWDTFSSKRDHLVIEHVSGGNRHFLNVQFDYNNAAAGIHKGLFVCTANTVNNAYKTGVSWPQISWVVGFDFPCRLTVGFCFLKRQELGFR